MNKKIPRTRNSAVFLKSISIALHEMPWQFSIMLLVNVAFAIIPIFGISLSRTIYTQVQLSSIGGLNEKSFLLYVSLYFLYLILMKLFLIFYKRVYLQYGTMLSFEKKIKEKLHKKCNLIPLVNYESANIENRIWEAKVASINIYRIVEIAIYFISIVISIILLGSYVSLINPWLVTLVILSGIPALVEKAIEGFINQSRRKKLTQLSKEEFAMRQNLLKIPNLKEIRVYNSFDFLFGKWMKVSHEYLDSQYRVGKSIFKYKLIMRFLKTLAVFGIYLLCSLLLLNQHIDFGGFIAALMAALFLQTQYDELFSDAGYLIQFLQMGEPFFSFVEEKNTGDYTVVKERVELKNASFIYPSGKVKVVKNLNFQINKNEKIAIVGINGAGKSTIAKMILGFLPPCEGTFSINGTVIDLNNLCPSYYDSSAIFQNFC